VRFVLDSVFIGPSPRETYQISSSGLGLPPIYLEDLLNWIQNFVGKEAQDAIANGGKPGIGLEFITMIDQLRTQAWGLYSYAQTQVVITHPTPAITSTGRLADSTNRIVS